MQPARKIISIFFILLFLLAASFFFYSPPAPTQPPPVPAPPLTVRILDKQQRVIFSAPITTATFSSSDNVLQVLTVLDGSPFPTFKILINGIEQPLKLTGTIELKLVPK
mgnify:CR=1 FL=1